MGEFSASDCSWKKMVIAKANDKWISSIKYEQTDAVNAESTSSCSLGGEQVPFHNVKREHEDDSFDRTYPNIQHEENETESMVQEMDPLLIENPAKRRRRKGSGPKNETPEERAARLAKMSAYAAQRLANETPEQRALRLKRMSEYAAKRLAQETAEQRATRLYRMSAYAARRLAKESPEQRQARLARMSAYAARRQALKKITMHPATVEMVSNFVQQRMNDLMPDQS